MVSDSEPQILFLQMKTKTLKTIMALAAFALAIGDVQATPLSVLLGLPKATADLTPADIDRLTKLSN
jgi:hypothetical protein